MSSALLVQGEREIEQHPPRRNRQRWVLAIAAAWLLSGVYLVQPDQEAVLTTFGKVASGRVLPGLHYALPWPVDRVYKLKVHQLRRIVIGGDTADIVLGRVQPAESQFLSGDQNLFTMRVVIQYSVSEPSAYLFRGQNVDEIVGATVESELSRRVARTRVDDILTTEKVAIQQDVLRQAQQTIEAYGIGVLLSSVNVETASPPAEAADAFRDVAGARADALRIVNQAQGYANDLIPRARGEADQLLESARAYKDGTMNRASGDASRFVEVAAEYAKAPSVTGTRAYLEAMEQILPRIKKLIIDSDQNLDVTFVGRQASATATNR
ncbi:MAG: FtsH protease activity modulator HflK [Bryobacteraceae bacterium]